MSFGADVRVARDGARSLAEREAALVRCVSRFSPFGLLGTFAHLDRLADDGNPAERLARAVAALDAAQTAGREELTAFAQLTADRLTTQRAALTERLRRAEQTLAVRP